MESPHLPVLTVTSRSIFKIPQENLNLNNTAIDEIWNTYPRMTETHIRSSLAAFLFKGDEVYKPLSAMSGGEKD